MAANGTTIIGRTTRVRGRISGDADLEVRGFVEGDITVSGDVTIESDGLVSAGVRGRHLVVRGAVKGDLIAEKAILLEEGARVLGDVRAPRVTITEGALVRGYVQTADEETKTEASARTQPAVRPATTQSAARAPTPTSRALPVARASVPSPSKPDLAAVLPASSGQNPGGVGGAAKRMPPPPDVPALRKLKGQVLRKKER